jgi:hypothetical protein
MIDFITWSEITGVPVNPPTDKKLPDFYVLVTFNGNYTATLETLQSNSILVKDATLAQLKAALYVLSLGIFDPLLSLMSDIFSSLHHCRVHAQR